MHRRVVISGIVTIAVLCALFVAPPLFAQDATPIDGGWPRAYTTPSGGEITLYAPQVSSWDNQTALVAFCAVSYLAKGASKAELGTVKLEADTKVSLDERLVNLVNLRIVESNFQTLSKDQAREIVTELMVAYPDTARVFALDRALAAVDKSQIMVKNVEGVKADPPTIYHSTQPAVLVIVDGEPIWSPIKDNDLEFAINTNWDLFQHTTTNTLYLRDSVSWLTAPELKGPWAPAGDLPESFKKLPDDENWKDVKANVPGKKLSPSKAPVVFATPTPAELILLEGEPEYKEVEGTQLQWISNTGSDLFRMGKTGSIYFLVAGRWFSAPDFTGPWTFATPNLPEDFQRIPPEHERAHVLSSVPGTDQSAEAILLAHIPQTARINAKELKAPEVSYQGDPEFKPIEGTTCQEAVNTDKDIIKVGDLYYMCFQGVWFMSRTAAGPWEVTSDVPNAIYDIPPSSDCHHVTYVVVEDDDPADVYVNVSYTSGYTGVIIAWGVVVYGTGWYYPPYVYWGPTYPVYYPRWPTYGCGAWYNPWTGYYGRGAAWYGPHGGAGFATAYNPHTGTYARGVAAYGPYGAQGAAQAWNPYTGTYAATRQGSNAYGSWGSTYVERGDDWVKSDRYTSVDGTTRRVTQSDDGVILSRHGDNGSGFVASDGDNIYAGHDGNVYKKNENGEWQSYNNGEWSGVDKSTQSREVSAQQNQARQSTQDPTATSTSTNTTKKSTAASQPSVTAKDTQRAAKQPSTSKTRQPAAGASTTATRPSTGTSTDFSRPSTSSTLTQLERDRAARTQGTKRTNSFSSQRSAARSGTASRSTGRSGGGRRR